jgi:hypothetical protein
MRRALALLAAPLCACGTMDHEKVDGWPELAIFEHRVPAETMREHCRKYAGFGSLLLACAEFNLAVGRCDIWLSESFAPRLIIEHERLHCWGYDHVGSTYMRDFLARYRAAANGATAARAAD